MATCWFVVIPGASAKTKLIIGAVQPDDLEVCKRIIEAGPARKELNAFDVQCVGLRVTTDELVTNLMRQSEGVPDVLILGSTTARILAPHEVLAPLDKRIGDSPSLRKAVAALYPGILDTGTWQDSVVGVPLFMDVSAIVFDSDRVKEAGVSISPDWDWTEFANVARKLAALRQKDNDGAVISGTPESWLPFVWSNGGEYLDRTLTSPQLHKEESKAALRWLQEQINQKVLSYTNQFPESALLDKRAMLAPASLSVLRLNMEPKRPSLRGQPAPHLTATLYPTSPTTGKSIALMSSTLLAVNAHSPRLTAAIRYMEVAMSPSILSGVVKSTARIPARADVALPNVPGLPSPAVFRRATSSARPYPPPFFGDRIPTGAFDGLWMPMIRGLQALAEGKSSVDELVLRVEKDLLAQIEGARVAMNQ